MPNTKILIVEDNALISMLIETTLKSDGHTDLAACHTITKAMELLTRIKPQFAILDFNLGGGSNSIPIAHKLTSMGVPFILLSGYTEGTGIIPYDLGEVGRLKKPFQKRQLLEYTRASVECISLGIDAPDILNEKPRDEC